jgi:hypothetical protein
MINGIPTINPTIVKLATIPTIIKTNPMIAPTNRPVNRMIPATSFQINQNG